MSTLLSGATPLVKPGSLVATPLSPCDVAVALSVNANVTYRIVDARKPVSQADDVRQALYRETQLALRAVIGALELDAFLVGKDTVA